MSAIDYLLNQDGFYTLLEDGGKLILIVGDVPTALGGFLLQEDGFLILKESGDNIVLEEGVPSTGRIRLLSALGAG